MHDVYDEDPAYDYGWRHDPSDVTSGQPDPDVPHGMARELWEQYGQHQAADGEVV